jgi:hypothetical protein
MWSQVDHLWGRIDRIPNRPEFTFWLHGPNVRDDVKRRHDDVTSTPRNVMPPVAHRHDDVTLTELRHWTGP